MSSSGSQESVSQCGYSVSWHLKLRQCTILTGLHTLSHLEDVSAEWEVPLGVSVSTRGHCSGKRKSYTKYTRHDSVGVKVFRITVTLKAYKCIKSDLDI